LQGLCDVAALKGLDKHIVIVIALRIACHRLCSSEYQHISVKEEVTNKKAAGIQKA
jgi:hypothetical protein